MKTSNYILIAVFILFIASILTFFITSKKQDGLYGNKSTMLREILLPDTINMIVAESDTHIFVEGSDKNSFLWNDQIQDQAAYRINADTLFVNVKNYSPSIRLNHSVSIIGQKNNRIDINDFKTNKLTVQKTGGNLSMKRNNIDTLQIKATDGATVHLYYNNQIDYLSADMKNGSSFNYTKDNKIGKLYVEGDIPNRND